jgi:hypothetical protein
MSSARKILVFGGLVLAAFGMLYGLHYALFVEHQTLDAMGGSLATGFSHAAEGNIDEAQASLQQYASTKYVYVRQVDVHSHWIGLAMLMIVMGVIFDSAGFSDRLGLVIAVGLSAGSVIFPLGVLLQSLQHGSELGSALAIAGSALVTISLAVLAFGFIRQAA